MKARKWKKNVDLEAVEKCKISDVEQTVKAEDYSYFSLPL